MGWNCCTPGRSKVDQGPAETLGVSQALNSDGMVLIPPGPFQMGSDDLKGFAEDGEGPVRTVDIGEFMIDAAAVTNAAFASFCRDTNYVTDAEWEKAARGGLDQMQYPWGDDLEPQGRHMCNIWQGTFPRINLGEDGYFTTAPVKAFPPNGFGLYQTSGNVWEWCSDSFSTTWHRNERPESRLNPKGPPATDLKVIRGGSYLCHASYCNRYRVAARSNNTAQSTTGHMGFRCAKDATAKGIACSKRG